MKSNILVLGGTGKTGRRIVDRLNRLGHTVLLAQHQSTIHRKTGISTQSNIESNHHAQFVEGYRSNFD